MPDRQGEWSYATQSNRPELAGKTEQDALVAYLQGLGTQIKARN